MKHSFLFAAMMQTFLFMLQPAIADIRIAPTAFYLDDANPSAVVTITSVSKYPVNVRMDLYYGYPHSDSLGNIQIYLDEEGVQHENSCVPFIRLHPGRFMLLPGQTRSIRFIVRIPGTMPDREYWARLVVTSEKRHGEASIGEGSETIAAGQSFGMRTILPVIYRKGDVATDITLLNVKGVRYSDHVRLFVDMQPIGNGAYVGNLLLDLIDANGTIRYSGRQEIAVFDMHRRRIDIPAARMPSGQYKVRIRFNTDREDMGNKVIPVLPREYLVTLNMP